MLITIKPSLRVSISCTLLISSIYCGSIYADSASGVAGVIDGDGLIVDGHEHRLFGIDAMELDQGCIKEGQNTIWLCGLEAKQTLESLVSNKVVTCEWSNEDRYQRKLSVCSIDELDINAVMVSLGYAVAYTKYSTDYEEVESKAIADNKGVWGSRFLMPWVHRKSGLKVKIPVPDATRQIKGNINKKGAHYYHCMGDRSYENTKITEAKGERWFATTKEAEQAGWTRPPDAKSCSNEAQF